MSAPPASAPTAGDLLTLGELQLIRRIREAAEHGHISDPDDPLRNSRTIGAGPLARIFMAPYWVNYHLEHHLFVPCWKLRRAHAVLRARGYRPPMEVVSSYAGIVRRLPGGR